VDADRLWLEFADHLARLYGPADATVERGPGWLAVLSREQHTDVNICVLLSDATPESSEALARFVEEAAVPGVVSTPTDLEDGVLEPLRRAGFVPEPLSEPLMWLDSRPLPSGDDFEVRRVRSREELALAIEIAAEGHGFERSMLTRILARTVHTDDDVATWIAWSGGEGASVAWLTAGPKIGVWQMNTPPRHRRRGAARATLVAALNELWDDGTEGAFLWASPAGRPLYERVGFVAVAERHVWVLGGDEAGSAAIGQPR
jgi:GNAT superfamily N-acetyltransferase